MRVVIPRVTTMFFHKQYDGGAKFFEHFSEYLVKNGVEVIFITTIPKDQELKKKESIIHNGVKYVFLPPDYFEKRLTKNNIPYKMIFSWNVRRYLEKIDFDVVHGSEFFTFFYLKKKNRKPAIMQCFGLEPFYGPATLAQKGLRKILIKFFLKDTWMYCLKKSELVASEGEFQTPSLSRLGISPRKIVPFPNGLSIDKIKIYGKNYQDKRKKHGIKKNDLLLLNVNQIVGDKRVQDVVNAFALLKEKVKNSKLVIIGKGILEQEIHNKINALNLEKEVICLKNLSEQELYDYYFSSDIFINASIQEDFIMGIQEAMACGKPIVSSRQPFLVKNGVNGYVVGMKNPKGISEAILKIWKSGKKNIKKMGEESRKMAEEYDYENLARTSIEEYKKLVNN